MAVQTYILGDLDSPAPASRLFKAYTVENHLVVAKALPHYVKSIDIIQGDPYKVGCIKQSNLADGGPFKSITNVLEEVDMEKLYAKSTTTEGDVLEDKWERVVIEHKFEPSGSGSHYLMTGHYYPKGDDVDVKTEEELAKLRAFVKRNTIAISEYLLANPQVCA